MSRIRAALAGAATAAGLVGVLAVAAPAGAVPGIPDDPQPPEKIGSGRVIVLRPLRIDLVYKGRVERVIPVYSGEQRLADLSSAIDDPRWATLGPDGTLTLRAGLMQRPGTNLTVGAPVRTLRLVDSATSPSFVSGSAARVTFDGVTVTSVAADHPAPAATAAAVAAESAHRPYVEYTHDSTVTVTGAAFHGLGSATGDHVGVRVGSGTSLTATDATFHGSGRGLDVDRAGRVSLTRVTASANSGQGIVIDRAGPVTLADVAAVGNTTSGIVLNGPLPGLRVEGSVASRRNGIGIDLSGLGPAPVGPFRTDHNATAGTLLRRCGGCVVQEVTAAAETVGVLVSAQSPGAEVRNASVRDATGTGIRVAAVDARIDGATVTVAGGATGVRVPAPATGVRITQSAVVGGRFGISVDADRTAVTAVTVGGATTGVRVGGTADEVTVSHVTVRDAGTGVVANVGTRRVALSALDVRQDGGHGIRSAASGLTVDASSVVGARIGLDLRGGATVSATSVSDVVEAVHAGRRSRVELRASTLTARVLGMRVVPSARAVLVDSTVTAPLGVRGEVHRRGRTRLPALPIRWLAVFGIAALATAVGLESLRKFRERGSNRPVLAPKHVTNLA